MNYSELFAAIDALEEEYIRFWEDICLLESPTSFKAGVDAVGEFCKKKAESLGWETETHYEEVSGNAVCITMNPNASKAAVCFSGHMDTVQSVGSCGTPAVHKDDTYIYGPGVKDCKGGIEASSKFYGNAMAGKDTLTLIVAGNDEQFTVTALFDNLGKGASGAAVQNMNIMLGLDETTSLTL